MKEIRQLTKDDIIIVNHLARDIWPEAFKDILDKEQIDYMLDWMYDINTLTEQAQTGHLFYMITEDGVPKGFLGLEPNYPDVGSLRIHKLYVKPSDHGTGLGRALMEKSFELARTLDLQTVNLNVNRYNRAVQFYQYFDFMIVKEEDIRIGKGFFMNDYVMVKQL